MPVDLFGPLDRVVNKYKRDVNVLGTPASPDALAALEGHLGRPIPRGLRELLARHNGGSLFRGLLRLRNTSEIATASESAKGVYVFADGPHERRWAWAQDPARPESSVFGEWVDDAFPDRGPRDAGALVPYNGSFAGWLAGTLAVLDSRVEKPADQAAMRLEADPDDLWQLIRAGTRFLREGQAEDAARHLKRATAAAPHSVEAWQRLGDALAATDRHAARMAWQQAFRTARLPLPWAGAPCLDPDVFRHLGALYTDPEAWEQDLQKFLAEQVGDVGSPIEAEVAWAAARELAKSLVHRGQRTLARAAMADLLSKSPRFSFATTPWGAVLELARLEFDLGHHDETEALLRRVRREAPAEQHGSAHLLLARLAITRQEPWAEEMLEDARATDLSDDQRVEAACLAVERATRSDKVEEARAAVEETKKYAQRVTSRAVAAQAALAEADLFRLTKEGPKAMAAIKRGLALLQDKDDPETRLRLVLRLGDLYAEEPRTVDEAIRCWKQAAEGFRAHELPVREAWALLRLARYAKEPVPLLIVARDRFAEADLAAGVAAADAAEGDSLKSLTWHLDRATAQARARHDAQRSRPPWDRSDADRPERRIGAHRLAIAACSERAVHALAAEMDACTRAITTGRGRALDPPVLRYIAAVDLLAAHRSYTAAQILLANLLQSHVDGNAQRALQGAIARSPNAALTDALLSVIESPQKHPADAVANAAEVLGVRREKAATKALCALVAPGQNPIARKAAVSALGRIGDRSAVDKIVVALDDPQLAEVAALALLLLGNRLGLDFHGKALSDGRKDLSGSPGEIVGRYGGPAHLLLLIRVAESGTDERALGAMQGLGLLGDPRAVPTLLEALASRDRHTIEIASGALQILTGHIEAMDETGARSRWNAWWDAHGPDMKDGVRHRDGKVFDGSMLIDKMTADDAWVRRTAYDELVILSGANLPFDAEGPWRVQQSNLRAWRAWWKKNGTRLMPGRWYVDGQLIS